MLLKVINKCDNYEFDEELKDMYTEEERGDCGDCIRREEGCAFGRTTKII